MVGVGLTAIFFLCTLACWAVWSLVYFTFASHYFLTTLTESSSGQDEVYYPREGMFEWWWKPILFIWAFAVLVTPTTLILSPLAAASPTAFVIVWAAVLWFLYPLTLASILYSQSWLVFFHRQVIGRMLRHFSAFVYVHVITFALLSCCLYLILRGITDIIWLAPAVLLTPVVQLLYARHWGRFAWLSLNFLPRAERRRRPAPVSQDTYREAPSSQSLETATGIRPGPPPDKITNIQPTAAREATGPAEAYDEWTDLEPYKVAEDPSLPPFEETAAPTPQQAVVPSAPVITEEEDEWATDKKPYLIDEAALPVSAAPLEATAPDPEANDPQSLTQYYDKRAKKEAAKKRKEEAAKGKLPSRSKKTPTFQAALLVGVWKYLFYPSTLMVWANLVVFTFVEFLLLYLMVMFSPLKGN